MNTDGQLVPRGRSQDRPQDELDDQLLQNLDNLSPAYELERELVKEFLLDRLLPPLLVLTFDK